MSWIDDRPGHKILSKFQVQGQVAIFYIQDKNQVLGSLKKKQAQARISSFKKVQTRIVCVNQTEASKTRIKHWAKNPKYFEL